jgi:hypothetical protein
LGNSYFGFALVLWYSNNLKIFSENSCIFVTEIYTSTNSIFSITLNCCCQSHFRRSRTE